MVEAAELATADDRVFEVHPEVSFCELAGECVAWSKKSWNGRLLRRRLLADAGIVLPDDVIPEVARCGGRRRGRRCSRGLVGAADRQRYGAHIAKSSGGGRRTSGGHLVLSPGGVDTPQK
jgi:hypothetical protein